MDKWTWGEDSEFFFHKYLPFMDIFDLSFIIKKQGFNFIKTIGKATQKNIIEILSSKNNINSGKFGGYQYLQRNLNEELLKNLESNEIKEKRDISNDNIQFLIKFRNVENKLLKIY